jgi:1,4-alpha-glucan branching enzyme
MSKSKQQTRKETTNHHGAEATAASPVHEVEFTLERFGAEAVYIAGDFNDWRPASLRMIGSPEAGLWEKRIQLPAGRHEYKFIVDGQWLHDPEADLNIPNIYGSFNSVLEVQS